MSEFKKFKRSAVAEMREVTETEIESFKKHDGLFFQDGPDPFNSKLIPISISHADKIDGSPKLGDMIARNPDNHNDQWLVAAEYFSKNFEPIFVPEVGYPKIPTGETAESISEKINKNVLDVPEIWKKMSEEKSDKDFNNSLLIGRGTFGMAVEAAKHGKKISRKGWNGTNMFAYYVPSSSYPAMTGVAKEYFGEGAPVPYREYLALKTAQGDVATWAPSGSDALAEDWMIVD